MSKQWLFAGKGGPPKPGGKLLEQQISQGVSQVLHEIAVQAKVCLADCINCLSLRERKKNHKVEQSNSAFVNADLPFWHFPLH